jgi:outer membrane protein TolC
MQMKQFAMILSLLLLIFNSAKSNNNKEYLNEYIEIGLKKNLELKSEKEVLNSYNAKVNQAMSGFLPRVDVNARYTRAGGGRSFIFPLGQMMNPLYEIAGLPQRFKDEEIPFLRPEEQETKISLVQPIINLAIYHNYQAQSNQYEGAKYDFQAKELNTAYSIKLAYYNYARTLQLVEIQKASIVLGTENFEVAKKLYEAGKGQKTDMLRAEVALSAMKQGLQSYENNVKSTGYYFNSLLNRELDSKINYDSLSINDINIDINLQALKSDLSIEEATQLALDYSPEIKMLETNMQTTKHVKSAVSGDYLPSLALAVDYGVQGENYEVDSKAAYWMVSGVLSWNLFSGFGTDAKLQDINSQISSLEIIKENLKQMIKLQIKNSINNLNNDLDQLKVAYQSFKAAEETYFLNKKSYEEGINIYINLLEAEKTYKESQENYFITYYNILYSKAMLDNSLGLIK